MSLRVDSLINLAEKASVTKLDFNIYIDTFFYILY